MAINDVYLEKLLCEDAAKIIIDEEFKYDLKNTIMIVNKNENIREKPKHKNNFMKNKYFKIASGFVICVFVGGTIFKAIEIPSKNIFTNAEGTSDIVPIASAKGLNGLISDKTSALQALDDNFEIHENIL